MDVSVIICTYNRCESLRATLDGFCKLKGTADIAWELLVIDNNSKDQTREVCQTFSKQLPIRYIVETVQGQSAARNRGIVEATGSLLLFTDDDVDLDPEWISNYWNATARHPDVSIFGGRII